MDRARLPYRRLPGRAVEGPRRTARFQPATTLALAILFALAVIVLSIGFAQADTLGAIIDSDSGRLALLSLLFLTVVAGGLTATVMWLTAPAPPPRSELTRLQPPSTRRPSPDGGAHAPARPLRVSSPRP